MCIRFKHILAFEVAPNQIFSAIKEKFAARLAINVLRHDSECKAMAKLGDLLRATVYSVCLPGWLNMRVTSEQHVPRIICMSRRQELLLLSPRNICVSLAINFVVRYKVSEVAKRRDTEGTSMSRVTCVLVQQGFNLDESLVVWKAWIAHVPPTFKQSWRDFHTYHQCVAMTITFFRNSQ